MKLLILLTLLGLSSVVSGKLLFSEILYDAPTPESSNEWIEIHNTAPEPIELGGLVIEDNSGSYAIPAETTISAGGYLVFARNAESFNATYGFNPDVDGFTLGLNNGGDKLELKEYDNVIDYVEWESYQQNWSLHSEEGETLQRNPSDSDTNSPLDWLAAEPTPSAGPAEPTTSSTQTTLTTETTSTTTTTINPSTTGSTTSTLESTTSTLESTTSTIESTTSTTEYTTSTLSTNPKLIISEVCYDTPGNDNLEEWVELYNTGSTVNIIGLTMEDGKDSYTLPDYVLASGEAVVIARDADGFNTQYGTNPDISGLTLNMNNNGDKLTLKNGEEVLDELAWEDYLPGWSLSARTGECLQQDSGGWIISDTPTPGENTAYEASTTTSSLRKTTSYIVSSTPSTTVRPTTSTTLKSATSTTQKSTTTIIDSHVVVEHRFTNPKEDACQNGARNQGEGGVDCEEYSSPRPTTTTTSSSTSSSLLKTEETAEAANPLTPPTGYAIAAAGTGGGLIGTLIGTLLTLSAVTIYQKKNNHNKKRGGLKNL
ncbi:MAG: lamin tail domain-containing protein [Candidatus Altiarchaeota archaeon]